MKTKIFRLTRREEGAVRSPLQVINDRLACRIHFHPLSYVMGANRQAQFIIASPNHFSTFTIETISSFRERGHNPLLRGQSYAGKPVESILTHISYWFHSLRTIFKSEPFRTKS